LHTNAKLMNEPPRRTVFLAAPPFRLVSTITKHCTYGFGHEHVRCCWIR
jgi:hypothetical protein